jgi:hypothetical protein
MMQERPLDQKKLQKDEKKSSGGWVKRLGFAGFMFFLIKGLLWLIIPALATYFAWL